MNENDKKIVIDWLNEKWSENKRICEICASNQWTIGQDIITPMAVVRNNKQNSLALNTKITPFVTVTCINCGNTKQFSAIIANLFKKEA
jgi:predicted nucleic-acid-binding Zn-ribbon protein